MRFFSRILGLLFLSVFLEGQVCAQQPKCEVECQERYVRQFATILSKNRPSMADYFVLFAEPEGPEGTRLFYTRKKQLIMGEDKDHVQEMTLAGDAFDEVMNRDKGSKSFYLACLHKRYANRLPSKNTKHSRSVDADSQLTVITLLSKKALWKFVFSDGELLPDSVIAPDGITLGDVSEDPCISMPTPTMQTATSPAALAAR